MAVRLAVGTVLPCCRLPRRLPLPTVAAFTAGPAHEGPAFSGDSRAFRAFPGPLTVATSSVPQRPYFATIRAQAAPAPVETETPAECESVVPSPSTPSLSSSASAPLSPAIDPECDPTLPRVRSASRPTTSEVEEEDDGKWQVKILYDGDCPICMKEVDFLQKRNEAYGTLKFVDISTDDYDPDKNAGITFEDAMGHIHGVNRDGTVVTGIEAFQRFYEVIGLGWVYSATRLKPVRVLADAAYELWAKYRLPLSGRPGLEALIEERRRAKVGVQGCENVEEECEVEY